MKEILDEQSNLLEKHKKLNTTKLPVKPTTTHTEKTISATENHESLNMLKTSIGSRMNYNKSSLDRAELMSGNSSKL